MADNTEITLGTGRLIRSIDRSAIHTQVAALDLGGSAGERFPGSTQFDAAGYAQWAELRRDRLAISVTPTISTSAYAAKDNVGALMSFANAARTSGGGCFVESVQVIDRDQEMKDLDLAFFKASITTPTDNAVFDPTDAELADFLFLVPIGAGFYADFNDNAIADVPVGREIVALAATTLYGVLIARGAPTYTATSDLTVIVNVVRG